MLSTLENGAYVLDTDASGTKLYLVGPGGAPEGDQPFIDEYDIATGESTRLWRSEPPYFEAPYTAIIWKRRYSS